MVDADCEAQCLGSPAKGRIFVDKPHQECVDLLDKVLSHLKKPSEAQHVAIEAFLQLHRAPRLNRTQLMDYRAGRIRRRISAARRAEIEAAIRDSAANLIDHPTQTNRSN